MKRAIKIFSIVLVMVFMFMIIGGTKVRAAQNSFHLITTNPGEDASTTIGINYHTYEPGSHIEYTLASDTNFANATVVNPTEKLWSIKGEKNADKNDTFYQVERYVCSATITNLTPCTKYKYRLVKGDLVSSSYFFTTAGLTNEWSFVALADCQYGTPQFPESRWGFPRCRGKEP